MKTISKFLLVSIFILIVGLGAISAADVSSDDSSTNQQTNSDVSSSVQVDTPTTSSSSSEASDSSSEPASSTTTQSSDSTSSSSTTTHSSDTTTKSDSGSSSSTTKDTTSTSTSSSTTSSTISSSQDVSTKSIKTSSDSNTDNTNITTKTTSNDDSTSESNTNQLNSNNTVSNKTELKTASTLTVTPSNYNNYFSFDKNKNYTVTTSLVSAGDTIDLQGTFYNVNFTIDKANITFTSTGKNAMLYNCTVQIQGTSSAGSTVQNLTIRNSNYYGTGIYANETKNIVIRDNNITVNGPFGFALAADKLNNSQIVNNTLRTMTRDDTHRTHTALAMGSSYYNKVENNTVLTDDANGIYLSAWGSGLFQGGYSDYNNITGNYVQGGYSENATSWCYCIQVMGTGNIISNNNVTGGYRGISTQDYTNNTIINNEVNATNQGIYACEGSLTANNLVHVNSTAVGIVAGGSGARIENNTITTEQGYGIQVSSSNVNLINNSIETQSGYGIYGKGQYTNINITNNTIISGKVGIIFKQQSSSKKINYVNVTRNVINAATSDAAIDFSEAGAKTTSDSHIYVDDSNTLSCRYGTGLDNAYIPPSAGSSDDLPDSNKTYTVTSSNYNTYFTDEYTINTKVVQKNDTLILSGDFHDVNFTCQIKVHIIGQNCTIYNGTISFTEDASASTLTNVTIKNRDTSRTNVHGVELIEVNNCNITNVTIDNYDLWESFGILVYSSNGNTITNNNILTSGDYVNYGIFVDASNLNIITDNKIQINQTSDPRENTTEIMFDDIIGTIKGVQPTYGIIAMYSSYNTVSSNEITTTSNFKSYTAPTETTENSITGIGVYYDSNYNNVTSNTISISSYGPFSYGIQIVGATSGSSLTALNATNNTFADNDVTVNGGYLASGINVGLNTYNTTVDNNKFVVNAQNSGNTKGDYAYGVTLERAYNSFVTGNTVDITGASVYGMKVFSTTRNNITDNTVKGSATNPYGLVSFNSTLNNITNNNFTMTGMNYGSTTQAVYDEMIPTGKSAIALMNNSYNNNITYNTIHTNASQYAVNLTSTAINTTVQENSIVSSNANADSAVKNDHTSNKVSNNFLYFTTLTVYPATGTVGYPFNITADVTSTATNLSNLTVTFQLGTSTILGSAKVTNGVAQITVNDTSFLKATVYTIIATVSGTNFQNTTATASLNLNKTMAESYVTVSKVTGLPGSTVTLSAQVTDSYNAQLTGNVTFILDGVSLGTVSLTLGRANITYKIPSSSSGGTHNITVIYNGNSAYSASEGSNILGIQTNSVTTVSAASGLIGDTITINAKFTADGKAVSSGTATVYVNGSSVGTASVSDGAIKFSYTIPSTFKTGTYDIMVKFGATDTVAASNGTGKLTVSKAASTINFETTYSHIGETAVVYVTVSNKGQTFNATSGNMTISINGEQLKNGDGSAVVGKVENEVVKFTFTAPSTLLGTNNISFTFNGNDQLNSSSKTFNGGLVIYQQSPAKSISMGNFSAKNGEVVVFEAQLKDENGNRVTTGTATFKLNGVTIKENGTQIKVNITNGVARYAFTVPDYSAKDYNLTVVASSKDIRLETSATFTIVKSYTVVELDGIITTGSTGVLTGTIYDEHGNVIDLDTKIAIKINGKTLENVRVSNGKINVTLDVSAYKDGIHNVTVVIGENGRYKTQTVYTVLMKNVKNGFVTVPVETKDGKITSLVAYATDSSGNRATSGSATFKLNDVTLKENGSQIKVSIVNGVARYNYTIPYYTAKDYKLTAVGNVKDVRYEDVNTLTIEKTETHTTLKTMSVSKGSNATLTGTILDEYNNPVTDDTKIAIKINGKTVANTKVVNGSINITLDTSSYSAGTYDVTIVVGENSRFATSTNSTKLTIK